MSPATNLRKILIISEGPLRRTTQMWEEIAKTISIDYFFYEKSSGKLTAFARSEDFSKYDRVVFHSGVRRAGVEAFALAKIPNLVIYDFDLGQEIVQTSKYYKKLIPLIKTMPAVHVILTSWLAYEAYRKAGVPCSYLPKAYDSRIIFNKNEERIISLGYVGRLKNRIYKQRRDFLAALRKRTTLEVLKTQDASLESTEYNDVLNRIQFYICPDFGLHEFMQKNFEAMGAGCILCTVPTAQAEADFLGFQDMKTVIFFQDCPELLSKLQVLIQSPEKAKKIATASLSFAARNHTWINRVAPMMTILSGERQQCAPLSLSEKLRLIQLRAEHAFGLH
jgi:hypothetical protein